MSGQVMAAVQRSDVPSCAPATEYVATPEGSSSAAPVMRPGPSAEKKRRTKFFLRGRGCVSDVVAKFVMLYQFVANPHITATAAPCTFSASVFASKSSEGPRSSRLGPPTPSGYGFPQGACAFPGDFFRLISDLRRPFKS